MRIFHVPKFVSWEIVMELIEQFVLQNLDRQNHFRIIVSQFHCP